MSEPVVLDLIAKGIKPVVLDQVELASSSRLPGAASGSARVGHHHTPKPLSHHPLFPGQLTSTLPNLTYLLQCYVQTMRSFRGNAALVW